MSTPDGHRFQVVSSGQVKDKLRDLHRQAKEKGLEKDLLSAMKRIVARLRSDPDQFGEPRFRLRHPNLEMRVGTVLPLLVVFGLHTEKRVVFIQDLLLLPY